MLNLQHTLCQSDAISRAWIGAAEYVRIIARPTCPETHVECAASSPVEVFWSQIRNRQLQQSIRRLDFYRSDLSITKIYHTPLSHIKTPEGRPNFLCTHRLRTNGIKILAWQNANNRESTSSRRILLHPGTTIKLWKRKRMERNNSCARRVGWRKQLKICHVELLKQPHV
jgi:hypothetical protein